MDVISSLKQMPITNQSFLKDPSLVDYVDSTIATKFGEFNIRVYSAPKGTETAVLWKGDLKYISSPLVRIHSECLTGDAFGGLNCDCGKQLAFALKKINKEGGILIYLRQEGRGIGLFEKIKTYLYQRNGYDTSDANVLLGHRPDERTYEMAKKVLDDLNIKQIRILTNNPIKVSELAKLGITIAERIPLIIKPNKYNQKYFITKKDKFNHSFTKQLQPYFYQFHVETANQISDIGEFLKEKQRDPFLKICVGIVTTENMLEDPQEIERIALIYQACSLEGFTPILHFSFRHSKNVIKTLEQIKRRLPFVTRLQLNDLQLPVKFSTIKKAFSMFIIDFPLCDKSFYLVEQKSIRNLIKKYNSFVLLDNSKGRGFQESEESLIKKVGILLEFGLNRIALYGGFGPNELETFFSMRNYFHLNFSIDAETKLKTNGKVDIQKTKKFLTQLLGFDHELAYKEKVEPISIKAHNRKSRDFFI